MSSKGRELIVEKFHKSTTLLAEKLVGESAENYPTYPFVVRVDGKYALFVPGADPKKADYDYLHPYIVSAGLTLELKIKHLHSLESKSELKGHNLLTLYRSLKEESKEFISSRVQERTVNSAAHQAIKSVAESQLNIEFDWNLEFLLEKSSFAFERWRYIYEANNSGSWFAGYIELYEALSERIKTA